MAASRYAERFPTRCKTVICGNDMTTPRQFLETVVRPNVADFHSHFAGLRHAHNAIGAVDALAAHLYVWATENAPHSRVPQVRAGFGR